MPVDKRFLFVSYAREDVDRVHPLVDAITEELAFRGLPVELLMDTANLKPGEQWNVAITEALEASIGFVFFVSPRSLRSNWVRRELEIAAAGSGRLIIPVILHEPLDVPPSLAKWQWLKFVGPKTNEEIAYAAAQIAEATETYLRETPKPRAPVTEAEAPLIAADIAQDFRSSVELVKGEAPLNAVFVVHGHDTQALTELEEYLGSIGVMPIVLSRQDESPQSLFKKFTTIGAKARFAIVLLCADDYGASRRQYDASNVGDRALQFRARQNVILELGFFYGHLGWEKVFVVYKGPDRVFPNFERPSDLEGVVFDSISEPGWRKKLGQKLTAAGFVLKPSGKPDTQPLAAHGRDSAADASH
jgi:predicted nucleotide-binding protein